jgi:hypothetical protein
MPNPAELFKPVVRMATQDVFVIGAHEKDADIDFSESIWGSALRVDFQLHFGMVPYIGNQITVDDVA